jgi:hypothetical protein
MLLRLLKKIIDFKLIRIKKLKKISLSRQLVEEAD